MCEELTKELADGRAAATALCEHLARMRADSLEQPIALEWGGQTLRFVVSARLDREEERWRKELADADRKARPRRRTMNESELKKDIAWILQSVPAELTTPAAQDTASRLVRLLAEKGVPFEPEDDASARER